MPGFWRDAFGGTAPMGFGDINLANMRILPGAAGTYTIQALTGTTSESGVSLHVASHYSGPDALDLDSIPGTLDGLKLTGGIDLGGGSIDAGTISAAGNLQAGANVRIGTGGINATDLLTANPVIFGLDLGSPMVSNFDAEFLGGQNSAFHLSRANHTGTQAPSTITGGSVGRFIRDDGSAGAWSALTLPNAATAGDLAYATGSNALGMLGIGAANRVLTSSGSAPQWSANIAHAALPTGSGNWDWGSGNVLTMSRGLRIDGTMGQSVAPSASIAWRCAYTAFTGASQQGLFIDPTFSSAATLEGQSLFLRLESEAASFTMTTGAAIRIADAIKGAGSTIGTQIGVDVANQTQGNANLSIRTGTATCQFGGAVAIGGAGSFGGGTGGVVFITNATAVPSTNPSGGGVLYTEAGALKYRGSSGTVTTLGAA